MTPYDDLLLWASEVGGGSLAGLKASASWVAPDRSSSEVVDDLAALGHVDVRDGRWVVEQPVLSKLANGGGNGLLVGARSRWLVETIDRLDESEDATLAVLGDNVIDNVRVDQEGPSSWYVSFAPGAPTGCLDRLGVSVVDDLSGAQLHLVEVDGLGEVHRSVPPGELAARAVGVGAPRFVDWDPVRSDKEPGSYMYLRNNQRVFATRGAEGWLETSRRWAEWLAVGRSTAVLWAAPRESALYCVAGLRLPLPVERALVLRTGRLPTMASLPGVVDGPDVKRYDNVPFLIAERVAAVVDKELMQA